MKRTGQKTALRVENVSKTYLGISALDQVSFNIHEGEILGIIGPNGAGKTTLFECLTSLQSSDVCQVSKENRFIPLSDRKQYFFYLPDILLPDPYRDVGSIFVFYASLLGASRSQVKSVVESLRLGRVLGKRIPELSKGYRKRALLGISLLAPQPILLLDEPFDGFDLRQTVEIMKLLKEHRSEKKTLVLSIHQLRDAENICDRFVLLREGKKISEGTLENLRAEAKEPGAGLEEVFLALT